MIRYIIVDDDPKVLDWVKNKIDTIAPFFELQHIKSYDSSKKAYENVDVAGFDLLIVDYEMPVYNGIELAQKIAENKKIIFLTSTINNGPKMMNALDVSGYMSKPFDIDEFQDVLKKKVIGKINKNQIAQEHQTITLNIGVNKDIRFTPDQLYYASTSRTSIGEQPNKNCVHFYGKNDTILFKNVRISINELQNILAPYNYEKIKQSTIINSKYLKERDNSNLQLHDCKETFEITFKQKSSLISKLRSKFKS